MHIIAHTVLYALAALSFCYAEGAEAYNSLSFEHKKGMLCKDHLAYTEGQRHEIIRSWHYAEKKHKRKHIREKEKYRMYFEPSFYVPRYSHHVWAPLHDRKSEKYSRLDLFVTLSRRVQQPRKNHVKLSFQREAKVYLMMFARAKQKKEITLPGWQPEGWAVLVKGSRRKPMELGVQRKKMRRVPRFVYVWSRIGKDVIIPNTEWVKQNFDGSRVRSKGIFNVMVAERNGRQVLQPTPPENVHEDIPAGGRCPQQLHDTWVVNWQDNKFKETRKKPWRTYHPLWDPCYWCAYDHEHGSDPKSLMGYVPKYHYTAYKNYLQNESHRGFKGIVLLDGDYYLYYGIHAHLSGPRRFEARTHTLVVAVTSRIGKKLLAELSFKADFGVAVAKYANGTLCPLKHVDQILFDKHGVRKGLRQVNIMDPNNIDRTFRVKKRFPTMGKNEHWFTHPLCSKSGRRKGVQVDFKDPGTALRTQQSPLEDFERLGRKIGGVFVQRGSHKRDLRMKKFRLAQDLCQFRLRDIEGTLLKNGRFYTDPFGKKLLARHGKNAIAQKLKENLNLELDGIYQPSDTWMGLHRKDTRGSMQDVGYAIDPSVN